MADRITRGLVRSRLRFRLQRARRRLQAGPPEDANRLVEVPVMIAEAGHHVQLHLGREPLVRRDVLTLVRQLGALDGLDELTITTNGSQLKTMAPALAEAGVRRLNISLDSLHSERFSAITRTGKLAQVLAGIDAAQKAGISRIKLNSVIVRDLNDDEVLPLLDFALAEASSTSAFVPTMRQPFLLRVGSHLSAVVRAQRPSCRVSVIHIEAPLGAKSIPGLSLAPPGLSW